MSASDLPELLPCPFCGDARCRVDDNDGQSFIRVACRGCGAQMTGHAKHFGSFSEAIAAWNTRAGDKRAREAVEAERAKRREVLDLLHKARDMCFEEARRLEAIDPNTRAAPAFTDWGFGARQAGLLVSRLAAAAWADYLDEALPPPGDEDDGQAMIERLAPLASVSTPGDKT